MFNCNIKQLFTQKAEKNFSPVVTDCLSLPNLCWNHFVTIEITICNNILNMAQNDKRYASIQTHCSAKTLNKEYWKETQWIITEYSCLKRYI